MPGAAQKLSLALAVTLSLSLSLVATRAEAGSDGWCVEAGNNLDVDDLHDYELSAATALFQDPNTSYRTLVYWDEDLVATLVDRRLIVMPLNPLLDPTQTDAMLDRLFDSLPTETQQYLSGEAYIFWVSFTGYDELDFEKVPSWSSKWNLRVIHEVWNDEHCLILLRDSPTQQRLPKDDKFPERLRMVEKRFQAAWERASTTEPWSDERIKKALERGRRALHGAAIFDERRSRVPWGAVVLAALMVLFFALTANDETAKRMAACYGESIRSGEYGRLLSYGLMHRDLGHLANNIIALGLGGYFLEASIGPERFVAIFVAGVVFSGACQAWAFPRVPMIGASGGCFAVMMAVLALSIGGDNWLPRPEINGILYSFAYCVFFSIIYSFKPGVSWLGHLTGATLGALVVVTGLLTLGLPPLADGSPSDLAQHISWTIGSTALAVLVLSTLWSLRGVKSNDA
jgi:membrane associated rhomboid family serine protease